MKALIEFVFVCVGLYFIYSYFTQGNLDSTINDLDKVIERSKSKNNVTEPTNNSNVDFYIRALGDVDQSDLTDVAKCVSDFYGYKCEIIEGHELTEDMKINGTESIINGGNAITFLTKYDKTIFVVDKEIWHNKKDMRGLASGNTVLIRGNKNTLCETAIHEIGHTLGLGHCDDMTCIMAIYNDEYESGDFCKKCKRQIGFNE